MVATVAAGMVTQQPKRLESRRLNIGRRSVRGVETAVVSEEAKTPLKTPRITVGASDDFPPKLDATLALVIVVYFLQGSLSLARLATTYYLKDDLGLSAAELGALTGIFSVPWIIKPLYGLASDSLPIWGSRRASYLALSGIVGCAAFGALATAPSKAVVVAANVVASASVAVSDVVADSIVVEESRGTARAADLQSAAWASRYGGAILASLAAGPALRSWGPSGVWLFSSALPLLVAVASTFVEEKPPSEIADPASAVRDLIKALSRPEIWRPAVFIFLWQATPSCGSAFFVFSTAPDPVGLGFDPDFVGVASAASSVAGLAGVAAYNALYKEQPLSRVIKYTSLASAVLSCLPLVLVFHANRPLGIDDRLFALGDDVVQSALGEIGFLPLLVLAANITPPGVEGVLFAALMSLFNLGGIVSQELGSLLTAALHVEQADFSNLPALIVICAASSALPLVCLDWVKQAETSKRPS